MIIVLDLDDTLLNSNLQVSSYSLQILKKLQAKGHKIMVSTLRSLVRCKDYARQINADYVSCFLGNLLLDGQGKILKNDCLKFNDFLQMISDFKSVYDCWIGFETDGKKEIIIDYREEKNVVSVEANGTPTTYMVQNEHIIIPAEAVKEGKNRINISFVAGNQSLNRREELLYTLLVPDRARTVFPCFDQPDLKGTFKLTLEVPEQWCAVRMNAVSTKTVTEP